jgi:hypothetical protein
MSGAIKTTTSMVLISIDPFTHRKILLIVVAFLGLSAFCFADPVLMAQRYTPNPGRLDPSKTAVPTGQQSEQPEKGRIVGPELTRLESSDQVRNEAQGKSTELWANLGVPPAEPEFGFSLRGVGVRWDLLD